MKEMYIFIVKEEDEEEEEMLFFSVTHFSFL